MTVIQKKICMVGDVAVGKTSLVRRYVEGRFDDKYLTHKVAKSLSCEREHEFVLTNDPDSLVYEKSVTILGSVNGIDRVKVFEDFRHIKGEFNGFHTRHFLKLADKENKRVKVIAVPTGGSIDNISSQVCDSLQELQDSSYQRLDRL